MIKATAIALASLIGLMGLAHATVHNLTATIDQGQEVPPSGSGGTGSGTMTFDDVTNQLNWNISWSGLSGAPIGMHFHGPAPAGVNAGVQVNIGAISGLTSPTVGGTTITALQGADLLNNLWYINIHTNQFMGGEIRGQVINQTVSVDGSSWDKVKALYR